MKVRLGINPLTWSNDDLPSLGAENSLETCLTEARAAGYEGVELGNKFPRQAATLRPILQSHGLDLVSGWYSGRLLERDADAEWTAMRAHFELLHALGCKVMVFAEVSRCTHGDQLAPISQRPHLPQGEWQRFGTRLTQLAERMKAEGAVDQQQLDALDAEVRAEIEDAVRFADESPDPDPDALYADVLAD